MKIDNQQKNNQKYNDIRIDLKQLFALDEKIEDSNEMWKSNKIHEYHRYLLNNNLFVNPKHSEQQKKKYGNLSKVINMYVERSKQLKIIFVLSHIST